ncbi:MAG: aminotransferase class V-fold PLP-dependent enzyme [Synergistaceae bacterium]|jgi:selenocysteine lyase/cysteine desulfurase|nr:aminotransferase class V-fold PLP-dependent enzyme [Synergistaceae bacterium]
MSSRKIAGKGLNEELIREEYGFLGDAIFLDVSFVVMPPRRVQEAYGAFMGGYVENFGRDIIARSWRIIDEARPKIARLLNARNPGEIAFVKNTCEGISILAGGYPFREGDEILIADQEHQSNLYPWINQRGRGVVLNVVKSSEDGSIRIEDMISAMNDRTRVLAVSSAQFSTGFAVDLRRLGEECRRRGIVFSVDGIQTLGRIEIDVREMNIDYLAAGGNKGLLGTLGAGTVYCSDRIAGKITPPYAAHQSVENHVTPPALTTDFERLNWHPNARRLESGNQSYNCILAISKGVDLILELGIKNIEAHIRRLEAYLREKIRGLGLRIVEPKNPANWSGIVCVYYPEAFEEDVRGILEERKIYATMRGGYLRFGIDFYNTLEQMDVLQAALAHIARLGK